jgi:hypothetical protein
VIDLPTVLHTPPRWWTPRFDVPEGITVIDLAEDPLAAAGRLSAQARSVLPGIPDDQVSHLVESQRAVVDALRAGGVYWAGSCVARSGADPGCLTVAHLAASLVETGTVDTDLAAAVAELNGSAGAASRQYPGAGDSDRVADVIQLPAGPAMLVISEQVIHPVRTTIGTPDGTARRIRQVLVALPVPGAARLAVLTLATEHLADWTAYLDLMARIARSLGFSSD